MAYPFKQKEVSRTKNVKILVNNDVMGNLPQFDSSGNQSSEIKLAVPKGEYVADKVNFEKFTLDDKSTGEKWTQYFVNVPIQKSYNVAPLSPYPISGSDVTELSNTLTSNANKKTITIVLVVVAVLGLLKWKKFI